MPQNHDTDDVQLRSKTPVKALPLESIPQQPVEAPPRQAVPAAVQLAVELNNVHCKIADREDLTVVISIKLLFTG